MEAEERALTERRDKWARRLPTIAIVVGLVSSTASILVVVFT